MIAAGRVYVNGTVVTQLGAQADPESEQIAVDGKPLRTAPAPVYLMLNKPSGYTTTLRDPHAKLTVMSLLPPNVPRGVVPVGRLDRDTEGLLMLTNDGELAHRLAHPRYEIEKEYRALVAGAPSTAALERLRRGIMLDGRRTKAAGVRIAEAPRGHAPRAGHTWLSIVVHEGRKRQVRRMCAAVGHPVRELVRVRVGDVSLGPLGPGKTRILTERDVAGLRRQVGFGEATRD
jgi:pseudouridine synthase